MHLNVLLLAAAAAGAVAGLAVRVAGRFRQRGGPAVLIRQPGSRTRSLGILGIIVLFLGSAVTTLFSLIVGAASIGCPAGNAGSHCDSVIGDGWLILMPTQVLILIAVVPAAVLARTLGTLAIAVVLGLGGSVLALYAFDVATTGAIPNAMHASGTSHPDVHTAPSQCKISVLVTCEEVSTQSDTQVRPTAHAVPPGPALTLSRKAGSSGLGLDTRIHAVPSQCKISVWQTGPQVEPTARAVPPIPGLMPCR